MVAKDIFCCARTLGRSIVCSDEDAVSLIGVHWGAYLFNGIQRIYRVSMHDDKLVNSDSMFASLCARYGDGFS
ncbi:hypothetical protein RAC83_000130 [Xylella fastidiosa]|nr:hypothetical protein [Xylella fastidiosa]